MKQLAVCLLLMFCPEVGNLGLAQDPPTDPVPTSDQPIRVEVNLVTLRFTVRDADGGLVNDLERDAFRILEEGVPQEIVFFQPPRRRSVSRDRLQLAFLLDVSGSTFATRAEEIVAAQTFMDNITDFTQVGIFGFTDKLLPFQSFTSDQSLALRAFQDARRHLGRTAIYASLNTLIGMMSGHADSSAQRAIIILSDGMDEGFQMAEATASLARQAGVVLYTILIPSSGQIYLGGRLQEGSGVNRRDAQEAEKVAAFERLSSSTDGLHFGGFEAILDFDDTLAQINDDLYGNLYAVGYYTSSFYVPNQQLNIDVIPPAGKSISAPFTRLPDQLVPKRSLISAFFTDQDFSAAAIDLPGRFREIAAEMDVLSGRNPGGEDGLPLRIKINPFSFSGATTTGVNTQLGVLGLLISLDGKEAVRLREIFRVSLSRRQISNGQGIIYTKKLLAPPGTYELRLVLLELSSWRLTSFAQQVLVR